MRRQSRSSRGGEDAFRTARAKLAQERAELLQNNNLLDD